MSKVILKTATLMGAALLMTACSGGGKTKFVDSCSEAVSQQIGTKDKAKNACGCMHERLDEELSGKQMKLATKLVGMTDNKEIREFVENNKGAELISEKVEGAAKSCLSNFL